jgi:hypothetical protein
MTMRQFHAAGLSWPASFWAAAACRRCGRVLLHAVLAARTGRLGFHLAGIAREFL